MPSVLPVTRYDFPRSMRPELRIQTAFFVLTAIAACTNDTTEELTSLRAARSPRNCFRG